MRIVVATSTARQRILADLPGLEPMLALGSAATRSALGMPLGTSAVLVGADGRIATRVAVGLEEVFGLLAGTLDAVEQVAATDAG